MTSALTITRLDHQDLVTPLQAEWDALRARAGAPASQTFAYAMRGWATTSPDAIRLNVIQARSDGRLVGLWPLYVARGKRGRELVRHLGCGGREEYSGPIIDPDAPGGVTALTHAMYDAAAAHGDVLEIYNAVAGSPLYAVVRADQGHPKFAGGVACPVVRCSSAASWQDWFAAKTKSFRDGRKQDRKRLMALGELAFRHVPAEDAPRHVDWFFDKKVQWLDDNGIGSDWMRGAPVRAFYTGLIGQADGVEGFALDLDGRTIASCICLRSATTLEFYVTTFDPEFARYSPGNVLIEELVRWCIERRLDFDFRLLDSEYKRRWADDAFEVETTLIAITGKGAGLVRERRWADRRKHAKAWLKSRLKRLKPS